MKAIRKTFLEMVVLGVAGLSLGAAANAVRGSGSLQWNKAYFAEAQSQADRDQATKSGSASEKDKSQRVGQNDSATQPAKHPYTAITVDEIVDIVGDPDYDRGRYVFVDARNQKSFAEGHIDGAIRCYHYELDSCIDQLLEVALGAEKVIVYCNGGQCDDSKYMCRELIDRGVPEQAIYLFDGGWEKWLEEEMPYVEGDE